MPNYPHFALQKLKDAGLKITNQRKLIVKFLANSNKALSPYEMRDLLKKQGVNADIVTIYRVLDVLENLSLAHKILALNGYMKCSTEPKDSVDTCHHYLICSKCHKVEEVEGEDLTTTEKKITKKFGFKIQSHYLEFMGICKKCQQR